MYLDKPNPDTKTIIILIKGTYTDSYNQNKDSFDIIGTFDLTINDFGGLKSPYDDAIRKFLKDKGVL